MPKRIMHGTVVSNGGDKTVAVSITRRFMHPVYKKSITRRQKYLAHDPENKLQVGDKVSIIEHKPISKNKRWLVVNNQAA